MDSEGMEALLEFPEFSIDAPAFESESFQESQTNEPFSEPPENEPSEAKDASQLATVSTDGTVEPMSSSSESFSSSPKRKRKHQTDDQSDAAARAKSIKISLDVEKQRMNDEEPSTSREYSREKRDDDDDDDGASLPLEQDFESDLLDLMPLKEEDPEDVAERQKLQLLISHLSEEQLNRYEVYRRASFPKAAVRRIIQTVAGCTVSQNAVIAMAGVAKMHVGEIVEVALEVKEEWGDTGPVQPKHLREALRKLRNRSSTTSSKFRKKIQTQ